MAENKPYPTTREWHQAGGRAAWAKDPVGRKKTLDAARAKAHATVKERAAGFAGGKVDPKVASAKANAVNAIFPRPMPELMALKSSDFKSFAAKIRHISNDGWEMINAVYEVFTRAREAHANDLILESATWLADRGFGKPVQVGQLLDAEGNAVAFTLWQPVAPVGLPAPQAEEVPDVIEHESIQHPPAEYEHPKVAEVKTDALALGPVKVWTTSKVDPIIGEEA